VAASIISSSTTIAPSPRSFASWYAATIFFARASSSGFGV